LNDVGGPEEAAREELQRPREELARLADVEGELRFRRARAETVDGLVMHWRTVQIRRLRKLFAALDRLRGRIAPPRTRREGLVLRAAHSAARLLTPLGRGRRIVVRRLEPRGHKDVLFIYDESGAWNVYRCDYQAEQLEFLGMSADIVRSDRIDLVGALDHYDTLILNRLEWTERLAPLIEAARRAEKSVIFGSDDLLFEPDFARHFAFLDEANEADRETWRERLEGFRRTLAACDRAIVSTDPLAEYARRHVDRVDVVYNAVSADMIRTGDEVLAGASPRVETAAAGREVTIGYLSGTPSHNRDFLEAADAVVWALENYPGVRFLTVGPLDLDARFEQFSSRVIRIPKQPFHELPKLTARIDINLAPLERDNPFTECKSCVKYLEAGLVRVPTIASVRPDFVRVIDNGRNGVLADEKHEWQAAVRDLIESPELRREIGARAGEDVREHHTTRSAAPLLAAALSAEPDSVGITRRSQKR
jgi:glycosyltransferase involved in cell wall biosynthesis